MASLSIRIFRQEDCPAKARVFRLAGMYAQGVFARKTHAMMGQLSEAPAMDMRENAKGVISI